MTQSSLDAPVSSLRRRLIDDMTMRRFSRETQRNYIRDVGRFATFLGRRLDTASAPASGDRSVEIRARSSYGDIIIRRP